MKQSQELSPKCLPPGVTGDACSYAAFHLFNVGPVTYVFSRWILVRLVVGARKTRVQSECPNSLLQLAFLLAPAGRLTNQFEGYGYCQLGSRGPFAM